MLEVVGTPSSSVISVKEFSGGFSRLAAFPERDERVDERVFSSMKCPRSFPSPVDTDMYGCRAMWRTERRKGRRRRKREGGEFMGVGDVAKAKARAKARRRRWAENVE